MAAITSSLRCQQTARRYNSNSIQPAGRNVAVRRQTDNCPPATTATRTPRRSEALRRMGLVCTTCRAMPGHGPRTAITTMTTGRDKWLGMDSSGLQSAVSVAAVRGSAIRGASARPAATGALPCGSSTSGFGLGGRSLRLVCPFVQGAKGGRRASGCPQTCRRSNPRRPMASATAGLQATAEAARPSA
jgi:hypothetical protein